MPIWLRKFTFVRINDYYEKEAAEYDKAKGSSSNRSTLVDPSGNINKEAFKQAAPKVTSGPKAKYK